ncbi:selenium metabolism-associated LysR family transcriptional regulator [Thermodesulfovibrio yellowstonii]|uniref:selenium metabolism-associated LysR family transcriptional regulator n=1 Tax=Thermodesulfovibrio yellowstonii TaxID=28262 RepID=UPI0024B3414C|nr:selenium metabolism-associated LysR family transcriptional regulator [Thermodesulfovibrio yellowstonii]MDI6864781.1 selenium metabolism-associated LysR family transcriptional regulator [Thermodesulfovibrio yellowstonii]
MEDHKLKVFCTVAETKSFSKTSEIIHLTQPAVSLQIQALEELYETKLFDRSSGSITLTPAGEILYQYAKQILTMYAEAAKEISKITGLIKGCVKIGAGTTVGNYILPAVAVDFKKRHPKIRVSVSIGNAKKILEMLNSSMIDFGIISEMPGKSKFIVDSIISDELCVICSADHPLNNQKSVSLYDVVKEPFVIREEGSSTRVIIEKFLAEHGLSVSDLHISLILGSTGSIKEAVERGIGLSIVSKWAIRKEISCGNLRILKLKEGKITRDFYIILPKNTILSPAVEEFITYLKNYPYSDLIL